MHLWPLYNHSPAFFNERGHEGSVIPLRDKANIQRIAVFFTGVDPHRRHDHHDDVKDHQGEEEKKTDEDDDKNRRDNSEKG